MTLRLSTPAQEGVYQGSKYLKLQVLCDREELGALFDALPSFEIYLLGFSEGNPIPVAEFLSVYSQWIEGLKNGEIPPDSQLRKVVASVLTVEPDALWMQQVPGNRFLVKMGKPVVQLQAHFFTYSRVDGVFRSNTMGENQIFWGLQWSYPQIYQDPKSGQLLEVEESPNSELFQAIKQWVRDFTRATPFVVDGQRTNVPMRLGKNCFSWIGKHPQLIQQGIQVYA